MSDPLPAAQAVEIDWKLVGSAVGVFLATMVTTVWGWMQGRKKSEKNAATEGAGIHIAGAVLQDNSSLRDNTQAVRDLRDQVMMLVHVLEGKNKVEMELQDTLEDLIKRLDRAS
jgi:cytosine/adenosine deaminase-related metal-dependent hydrolase